LLDLGVNGITSAQIAGAASSRTFWMRSPRCPHCGPHERCLSVATIGYHHSYRGHGEKRKPTTSPWCWEPFRPGDLDPCGKSRPKPHKDSAHRSTESMVSSILGAQVIRWLIIHSLLAPAMGLSSALTRDGVHPARPLRSDDPRTEQALQCINGCHHSIRLSVYICLPGRESDAELPQGKAQGGSIQTHAS